MRYNFVSSMLGASLLSLLGACVAPSGSAPPSQPGAVGPAPTTVQWSLDGSGLPMRSRLQPVALAPAQVLFSLKIAPSPAMQEAAKVDQTINSIIAGLEGRDIGPLTPLYVADSAATFFSPLQLTQDGGVVSALGRDGHMGALSACMENFASVKILRDGPGTVRMGDGLALWTGTGTNQVTFKNGQPTVTKWRWTMMLERDPGGNWLVTHEHSSFEPIAKK